MRRLAVVLGVVAALAYAGAGPAVAAHTDVAAGRTVVAYSTWSGSAANVVDGSDATGWVGGYNDCTGVGEYLRIDLGSAQEVGSYRLVAGSYAVTMSLQSSPDAASWTNRATGLVGPATLTGSFTAATARYWRVIWTGSQNAGCQVSTVSLFNVDPPAPTPTPTPTPTPVATALALVAEDRARVDLLTFAVATVGAVLAFTTTAGAIAGALRRGH